MKVWIFCTYICMYTNISTDISFVCILGPLLLWCTLAHADTLIIIDKLEREKKQCTLKTVTRNADTKSIQQMDKLSSLVLLDMS